MRIKIRSKAIGRIHYVQKARAEYWRSQRIAAFSLMGRYTSRQPYRFHDHIVLFFENADVADDAEAHLNEGDEQDTMWSFTSGRCRLKWLAAAGARTSSLGGYKLEQTHKSRVVSRHSLLFGVREDGSSHRVGCT